MGNCCLLNFWYQLRGLVYGGFAFGKTVHMVYRNWNLPLIARDLLCSPPLKEDPVSIQQYRVTLQCNQFRVVCRLPRNSFSFVRYKIHGSFLETWKKTIICIIQYLYEYESYTHTCNYIPGTCNVTPGKLCELETGTVYSNQRITTKQTKSNRHCMWVVIYI